MKYDFLNWVTPFGVLELLGTGSSRRVYVHPTKANRVIKVMQKSPLIEQSNNNEWYISQHVSEELKKYIAPVFAQYPCGALEQLRLKPYSYSDKIEREDIKLPQAIGWDTGSANMGYDFDGNLRMLDYTGDSDTVPTEVDLKHRTWTVTLGRRAA